MSTGSEAATSRSSSGLSGNGDDAATSDADAPSSRHASRSSTAATAAIAAVDGAATVGSAAAEGAAAAAAAQRVSDRAAELATPGEADGAPEANKQAASAWQQEAAGDPPWPGAAAAPGLPPQPQPLLLDAAERSGQPDAGGADAGQPYVLLEGVPHEVRTGWPHSSRFTITPTDAAAANPSRRALTVCSHSAAAVREDAAVPDHGQRPLHAGVPAIHARRRIGIRDRLRWLRAAAAPASWSPLQFNSVRLRKVKNAGTETHEDEADCVEQQAVVCRHCLPEVYHGETILVRRFCTCRVGAPAPVAGHPECWAWCD